MDVAKNNTEACTAKKASDVVKIEAGTAFISEAGYLVCVGGIWVENAHLPNPITMVGYSFTPLQSEEGKRSGTEQSTLSDFCKNILK